MSIFINILITSIIYLLLPIVFFILKKDISKKNRTIICAVYCAIVCLIIQIVNYNMIVNYKIKFTTGLFYYFVLTSIISIIPMNDKNKKKIYNHKSDNKQIKVIVVIPIILLLLNIIL